MEDVDINLDIADDDSRWELTLDQLIQLSAEEINELHVRRLSQTPIIRYNCRTIFAKYRNSLQLGKLVGLILIMKLINRFRSARRRDPTCDGSP
jgi:hypothetical protein